jgi:hypothetical protein
MVFSSTHLLLFPILLFKKAPSKIQMQTSAPCGIPKSAVWNVSNPSPLMTRVENCGESNDKVCQFSYWL